jgi:adenylate cyclase
VMTSVAIEARDHFATQTIAERRISFRIGLNSGALVAGVIGTKKFIYDVWGDTVNTASRMESHGTSGEIQITRATWELVHDSFECVPGGLIDIKGKGPTEVWNVVGPH